MAVRALPRPRWPSLRLYIASGRWRQALTGYLLVLPVCLILLGLVAYPFVYAIFISFTSRTVGDAGQWVGLSNYRYLFNNASFIQSLINTATLVVTTSILKLFIGLGLALVLNEKFRGRSLFRASVLIPWAMPAFVAFLTWRLLFMPIGGGVNLLLSELHIYTEVIDWLGQRSTAMPAVIIASVWRGFPFWCIMFLAALQNVPQDQYEAAKIDGANTWHRFRYITLPGIRNVILLVVVLSSIWTANGFEHIWIMTQGGPSDATMTLPVLAFFSLQTQLLGEAAAVSVAMIPLMAIPIIIVAWMIQKED